MGHWDPENQVKTKMRWMLLRWVYTGFCLLPVLGYGLSSMPL